MNLTKKKFYTNLILRFFRFFCEFFITKTKNPTRERLKREIVPIKQERRSDKIGQKFAENRLPPTNRQTRLTF